MLDDLQVRCDACNCFWLSCFRVLKFGIWIYKRRILHFFHRISLMDRWLPSHVFQSTWEGNYSMRQLPASRMLHDNKKNSGMSGIPLLAQHWPRSSKRHANLDIWVSVSNIGGGREYRASTTRRYCFNPNFLWNIWVGLPKRWPTPDSSSIEFQRTDYKCSAKRSWLTPKVNNTYRGGTKKFKQP